MKNVFIIGSKGIPAMYGGFETFVEKLTHFKKNSNLMYHVACLNNDKFKSIHNNARCFQVSPPNIGSAKAILYDYFSLLECKKYIINNNLYDSVIYVLACRIGPILPAFNSFLKKYRVKLFINPDGNEWKRSKWSYPVKKYWKISEKLSIRNASLIICDSVGIQEYIEKEYGITENTLFIPYGADLHLNEINEEKSELLRKWYLKFGIRPNNFYLIVGRFVPENNYELIIREFMKSNSDKDLVIITNHSKNSFYNQLINNTQFETDKRIKFVGTMYDQEILKEIRKDAYAYIHGHEVGGTNPSLLEAMATTKINLLLDVVFNKEVGRDSVIYFNKEVGNLMETISFLEHYYDEIKSDFEGKAVKEIKERYNWDDVVKNYENIFTGELKLEA